jgi:hypothetical protein
MNDLDQETERLNEALRDAEDAIVAHCPGVSAEVVMSSGMTLRFAKEGAVWGLFVIDSGGGVCPLVKAGRRHRVAAVACLNDMMSALGAARSAETVMVREAANNAAKFAAVLRLVSTSASSDPVKP